jgi:hypothetical protein
MILKAVMHVKVQALGMTFSAEKKMDLYMVLGDHDIANLQKGNTSDNNVGEPWKLVFVNVSESANEDMLQLQMTLEYNNSNPNMIVYLPGLALDVYYNQVHDDPHGTNLSKSLVGNITTLEALVQGGWNPLSADLRVYEDQVPGMKGLLYQYLNEDNANLTIRG